MDSSTNTPNFHEYASIFPLLGPVQHQELTADIKLRGLLVPIVTYHGEIIDGRNRYLACGEAGVEPRFEELPEGVDPLSFVVSANYTRRHLSESQRALAAARIEAHQVDAVSAAQTFKVSKSALKQAETVLKLGIPDLVACVENDKIPVNLAAKIAAMPEDAQAEATTLPAAELRGIVKRQQRIRKVAALAKATQAATDKLGAAVFPVLYADPPWRFEPWSANGMDRSPEYPTMPTASIAEMAVPAAEHAVLFLWSTIPMLPDALKVMAAWGFEYRSSFVWMKDRAGTGFWCRSRHEHLLIGVKGTMPAPDPSDRRDSVIEAPVTEHSAKPAAVRTMIEQMYPSLPRIELFARERHDGWTAHGNELPEEDTEPTAAEEVVDDHAVYIA